MSNIEEVADNSSMLHRNAQAGSLWKEHQWAERGVCPWCSTEVTPAKEPPPPATEERIEDIAEVLPPPANFEIRDIDGAPVKVYGPLLFGAPGEMTDGD